MMEFGDPKFMMVLLVVAVVMILIIAPHRRGGDMRNTCRQCGAAHPSFARFCRRCGKKL